MPEINTYLTVDDLLEIGEKCFEAGCEFVPDGRYPTPEYDVTRSVEGLKEQIAADNPGLWFVVSSRWQQCPLHVRSFEKDGIRRYYVAQKTGGPTLDIAAPPANSTFIPSGFIGYHSEYWDPDQQEMRKAPEELIACYKNIRQQVRKCSAVVRTPWRVYHVSRRVIDSGLRLGPSLEDIDPRTLRIGR